MDKGTLNLYREALGILVGAVAVLIWAFVYISKPEPNQPPSCRIVYVEGPDPLHFNFISDSDDVDGIIASHKWSINGEEFDYRFVIYDFPGPGEYEIVLLVTDDDGSSSECRLIINLLSGETQDPEVEPTPVPAPLPLGQV